MTGPTIVILVFITITSMPQVPTSTSVVNEVASNDRAVPGAGKPAKTFSVCWLQLPFRKPSVAGLFHAEDEFEDRLNRLVRLAF